MTANNSSEETGKDRSHPIEAYAPVALLIIFAAVSFFIIRPFFMTLITSAIIAYIFYPGFRALRKRVFSNNWLPALLITILLLVLLIAPSYFMIKTVSKEVSVLSILTKQYISRGSPFEEGCLESGEESIACRLDSFYSRLTRNPEILYYIQSSAEQAKELFLEKGSAFIVGIPRILANIGIMILSIFFFLKDSSKISRGIRKYIPLGNTEKRFVFKRFNELFYSIVYGNIITAFIQGCIAAVGLVLFGYPSPLIWGILTVFAAFIPVVGTGLVYLPLSLVQILMGVADSDNTMITRGIGFLLYGLVLVSNIDNLIRMKVIGDRASIHPLFVLIGVFGGLLLFGFVGIFIGPIILSLLFTFADLSLAPLQESHKQK